MAQWYVVWTLIIGCLGVAHATVPVQLIEYYGDSTVWGYKSGVGGQVVKPAPTVFAEQLRPQSFYQVRNEGVNGTTACDLLKGTDGKHPEWAQQMRQSSARYVIVNFGINDQWKHDLSTYAFCLQQLTRIAREHGKQMIFETPNPTRDSGKDGLDLYVSAMRNVAAREGVPLIDQYRYLTDQLRGHPPTLFSPDGLHPSETVYTMKGRYAAKVFMGVFGNGH